MKNTIFFLDYTNINRGASDLNCEIDYEHLKNYMAYGRNLIDAYCYVPLDPRNEHKYDRDIKALQQAGYLVTTKLGKYAGETYKCNFDVEMTIDIMRMAHLIKPNIIVLASGDIDFVPLISELRKMGIRVEVAAFHNTISQELILNSSGYINLNQYLEEMSNENENQEQELPNTTVEPTTEPVQQSENENSTNQSVNDIPTEQLETLVNEMQNNGHEEMTIPNFETFILVKNGTQTATTKNENDIVTELMINGEEYFICQKAN
ncbi:NYN domain-containing protein [bacterium]|nr:NYN domain-containing protein [Bacteroidota bacterium]MBU1599995.1 NYN domain-containing protein [bacterium]MBU1967531.1 NYN domain-containing protein [Patescibacteria group bacterium]